MNGNARAMKPAFSLLAPPGKEETAVLDETVFTDLNLDILIREMTGDKKQKGTIEGYTSRICLSEEAVNYRLDILEDLLGNGEIIGCLEDLASHGVRLNYYMGHPGKTDALPLQETVWRLRELEEYLYCMESLHKVLANLPLKSEGLIRFRDFIERCRAGEEYAELQKELPPFLTGINKIKSVTVAINLNEGLIPFEAALLEVNPVHYEHSRFFGKMAVAGGKSSVGPVHSTRDTAYYGEPTVLPLFKDLSDILGKSVTPLKDQLRKYGRGDSFTLLKYLKEFIFYRGAVRLIKRTEEKGFPMVRPVICSEPGHSRNIRGMYNLELVLNDRRETVITNDFHSSPDDSTFIITGPNNGGKTTYLRAVGIVQYLAQLGIYVPAEKAVLGVCSGIHTHFPNLETRSGGMGRFAEEAERLRSLIEGLQPDGLVLLNESLSSTNMEEAVFIARDILQVLSERQGLTLYVTHLHSLARGSAKCLVAQVEKEKEGNLKPSYRIIEAAPDGKSYALEMARNYGLGIDQLRS